MIELYSFDGLISSRLTLRDTTITDVAIFGGYLSGKSAWGIGILVILILVD